MENKLAVICRGKTSKEIVDVNLYEGYSFSELEKVLEKKYSARVCDFEISSDKLICEIAEFIEKNRYPI